MAYLSIVTVFINCGVAWRHGGLRPRHARQPEPGQPPHICHNTGSTASTYSYNGEGVRVGKTVGGIATSYLQDVVGGLPKVLLESTGGQETLFVYGNGLAWEVRPDGTHRYYHADSLGSTRVVTDDAGSPVSAYSYDAYGAVRASAGEARSFTYTGEQTDPESGLEFLRARTYDPATGRFLQRDSAAAMASGAQGLNRYGYVSAKPTVFVDPRGEYEMEADSQGASRSLNRVEQLVSAITVYPDGDLYVTTRDNNTVRIDNNAEFIAGRIAQALADSNPTNAVTFGSHYVAVYGTITVTDPQHPTGIQWLYHELGHVIEAREMGDLQFHATYANEYFRTRYQDWALLHEYNEDTIHMWHPLEIQANLNAGLPWNWGRGPKAKILPPLEPESWLRC